MPTNNRIFYATQLINLNPCDTTGDNAKGGGTPTFYTPRGVQSLGITTNFNLTEVFSIGQLEVYDQPEDLPDVEVTMTKVFDGTPPLYYLCMDGNSSDDLTFDGVKNSGLTAVGNNRVNVHIGLYPDTADSAFGTPDNFIAMSGMYLSSFTYTLGVDDNFTEDVTLVGNHKVWSTAGGNFGNAANSDSVFKEDSNGYRSSVFTARRMNIQMDESVFPTGTAATPRGGINAPNGEAPYFQNVTLSCDLGREEIRQLGRFDPYYRYITFPTEVTSEFEVVASEGDFLDADDFKGEDPCTSDFTQLTDQQIRIKVCTASGHLIFDLGNKNKITSVNYGGGDAGGDNVTLSYSFRNFNSFKIDASGSFENGDLCLSVGDTPPGA